MSYFQKAILHFQVVFSRFFPKICFFLFPLKHRRPYHTDAHLVSHPTEQYCAFLLVIHAADVVNLSLVWQGLRYAPLLL